MNEQISGLNISVALLSSLLVELWIGTYVTLALLGLGFPIFEMDLVMEAALPAPAFIVPAGQAVDIPKYRPPPDTVHTQILMNFNNVCRVGGGGATL